MLHAYIDESGQRGHGEKSSPHFLMSAAVVRDTNLAAVPLRLDHLRKDLKRNEGDYLSWKNFRSHADRTHIAKSLGGLRWLRTVSVVACKRHLDPSGMNESQMYLYQLRFLLERLSWLAKSQGEQLSYTLAHIRRFKLEDLREYEHKLQSLDTSIDWHFIDARGGRIDQPQRLQPLQLADLVTSATAAAFNPDRYGNTEQSYLRHLSGRIYRGNGSGAVEKYGLKMHPWTQTTKAAYPWIATL